MPLQRLRCDDLRPRGDRSTAVAPAGNDVVGCRTFTQLGALKTTRHKEDLCAGKDRADVGVG